MATTTYGTDTPTRTNRTTTYWIVAAIIFAAIAVIWAMRSRNATDMNTTGQSMGTTQTTTDSATMNQPAMNSNTGTTNTNMNGTAAGATESTTGTGTDVGTPATTAPASMGTGTETSAETK